MIWNKEMECADRETMRALQLEKLKKTVKYEYDNVAPYRKKMDDAGVRPEDIKTLEDSRLLPFKMCIRDSIEADGLWRQDHNCRLMRRTYTPVSYTHLDVYKRQI